MANERGASILVVDDDPEIVAMLTTRLGHRGYKVTSASDGHRAPGGSPKREKPDPDAARCDDAWQVRLGGRPPRLKQDPVTQGIKIVDGHGDRRAGQTRSPRPLYGGRTRTSTKPFEFRAASSA